MSFTKPQKENPVFFFFFFFEDPAVTGVTFVGFLERTGLYHVSVGAVFQLGGALLCFSHLVGAYLDREFPGC
jgi:hypothetical protein